MIRTILFGFLFITLIFSSATAQKRAVVKKYPSLFWEITGNGLKKPSYLFGTMHVSSKMVFHLSDSFYYAMRNTDAVALELNPEVWQDEMFRLQKAQSSLTRFSLGRMNDYMKESSFRIDKYEENIKRALTEEPTIVNNLLYRSYQSTADFEENTYLDLYIFQTGRKLGKRPAGVENYLESEKLMLEAFQDMAKDKTKRRSDDVDSYYDVQKKIQQAYRNGDLDLLDSLQGLTSTSAAFAEKFLYLRNEIQAHSIDTILKNHSLFVSVGAAHLPGSRGVIELLRKKGYNMRPIFMQDRDAAQKDEIDKLKVPVVLRHETTQDGMIQLQLPGKFYKREEARGNESWQFADMNNGSYYMLTRVRTHAAIWGHNEKVIFNKVDSMLYENIPGKILKKTVITKNGYKGFDITNRTRRGDIQRYEILVTPYEVLVFKMSGNDGYVEGKEADDFFNSIKVKFSTPQQWAYYQPEQGGFKVKLPGVANEAFLKNTPDGTERWEYELADSKTGSTYMIWKKSLYNFNFIEEDTFDLAMMEESFKSSEIIQKTISRKIGLENRKAYLESKYLLKDGAYVSAKGFVKGPHYYFLIERTKNKKGNKSPFLQSFQFADFKYPKAERFVDSGLKFEVVTAVKPNIDTTLRAWMEKAGSDGMFNSNNTYTSWPKNKTGIFKSDSTGESILATVQTFPKYYYSKDSVRFWKDKIEEKEGDEDLVFSKKEFFKLNDSISGYNILLTDTNSTRGIKIKYFLKGNNLYKFSTITDTSAPESDFVSNFFATAKPIERSDSFSVFKNKMEMFFTDYSSKDSVLTKQANQAIPSIYFGEDGIARIVTAISNLKYGDKEYFETKNKFITELGYISDSTSKNQLVAVLKDLYEKNADTSYFQNTVLAALARVKTQSSLKLLKDFLIQDPPVFDNSYDYERIFNQVADTLQLAKVLFPEILQLSILQDYKPYINTLLKSMVDSGYMKGTDYESYYSKLIFDAKIELKKQQNKDEKQLQSESDDEDNDEVQLEYRSVYNNNSLNAPSTSSLGDYATLLMPFYSQHPVVPKFFEKLLASKDVTVQLVAAKVLLSNNKKIPDSLFNSIAASDRYRAKLLSMLVSIKKQRLFPSKYKQQELIAKSVLLNDKNYKEFADIQLVSKRVLDFKGKKGFLYLFKYKMKKDDDWKIGLSGLQPMNTKEVDSEAELVTLTDRRLKSNEPEITQFNEQIKQLLFAEHKGGQRFFDKASPWDYADTYDD